MAKYTVTLLDPQDGLTIKNEETFEAKNVQFYQRFMVLHNGDNIFEDVVATFPDRLVVGVRKVL